MLFDAIETARSGLRVHHTWLDAVADNIANISTAKRTDEAAFQARYILAETVGPDHRTPGHGGGARVAGAMFGSAEGRLVYEPAHPLADEEGFIRMPDMDLGDQMVNMMLAQRAYQANLSVVERARTAYEAALQIGRG